MKAIGAHFSASLGNKEHQFLANYAYESARACLYALLQAKKPTRIHVPNYMCEAIFDAISGAGVEVLKYAINENFQSAGGLDLQPNDLILLVDYFGLNEAAVLTQLASLPKSSVIVDCSQAYFQKPFDCLATIYSPRKFIPVADGGFIQTNTALPHESADERGSMERYTYLLERIDAEPEPSRDLYLQAEEGLTRISLRAMSKFSKNIINMTDRDFIAKKRVENFKILSVLSGINSLNLGPGAQVPLCYPLMVPNGFALREKLKQERIFTPKYWPNVAPMNDFENELLENTVYLPIDHRYGKEEMSRIVELVINNN